MKSGSFKYVLIYCFAIALLFKTSGVVSVFVNSIKTAEYNSANQDSTEKEEKKIETEYFEERMLILPDLKVLIQLKEKTLLPQNNFFPSYFPEVLTPPPSLEA
ncbi:hypothetical protein [Pedobacter sp. Leaf176]|uniref:hypothetical protein n=1 Tax=Pedobacter sp. Leaf176 TaxID=1736286 RepID=UPI0006F65281|nr:hypothetical protein [Pedobacter sp. Leaf176]KQR72211.1 hypothetical protein ASF92_02635 [Pedobacter sp. Leaf176]